MPTTLQPLATATDLKSFGSTAELLQTTTVWTTSAITALLRRASVQVESKTNRRLAPFTGLLETHRANGIAPDEYGTQGDIPMQLTAAIGWSQARSLGVSDMVREFWLQEYAVRYPELWTVTLSQVEIVRTFGDAQTFTNFTGWQGPEPDTGHVKMPIGTYCPTGSTIRVTYSGGYSPIPDDLNMACVLQAIKLILVGAEPELREGMATAELDDELLLLLTPYVR